MDEQRLEVPDLEYFSFKNIYTGSRGDFRYRIVPEEGLLRVSLYERFCFEVAPTFAEQSFPLDEDGLEALNIWLLREWQAYDKAH